MVLGTCQALRKDQVNILIFIFVSSNLCYSVWALIGDVRRSDGQGHLLTVWSVFVIRVHVALLMALWVMLMCLLKNPWLLEAH
jgi:hypothetical protein